MSILKGASFALRFLLELCALAVLCYWGFKTGTGPISKAVLGIGVPLAAADGQRIEGLTIENPFR